MHVYRSPTDPPPQSLARVQMRISRLSRHEVRPVGVFACVCVCARMSPLLRLHTQMLTIRCQTPPSSQQPARAKCAALAALKSLIIVIRLSSGIISIVNQMSCIRLFPVAGDDICHPSDTFRATEEDTCPHQVVFMSHLHLFH